MTHEDAIQQLKKHAEIFKQAFNLAIENLDDLDPETLSPEQIATLLDLSIKWERMIVEFQNKMQP